MNKDEWEEIEEILQGEQWLEYIPKDFLKSPRTLVLSEQSIGEQKNFFRKRIAKEKEEG